MIYGFDVETAPSGENNQVYALAPWAAPKGWCRMTCMSLVADEDTKHLWQEGQDVASFFEQHLSDPVTLVAWNAVFDAAWLYAYTGKDIGHIEFIDAQLLLRHIDSRRGRTSLKKAAQMYLKDWEHLDDFVRLKKQEKESNFQTSETTFYNYLDSLATIKLYELLMEELPESARKAFFIEQKIISKVAMAYVDGMPVDRARVMTAMDELAYKLQEAEKDCGIDAAVLRSGAKLSAHLIDDLGIDTGVRTNTGKMSTSKQALAMLTDNHPELKKILAFKKLSVEHSKFYKSLIDVLDSNGSDHLYPRPTIFGTKTGRFTYSSREKYQEQVFVKKTDSYKGVGRLLKTSLAVHQLPKGGDVRKCIVAPEGYVICELDASNQEMRVMGVASNDSALIKIFNDGLDSHCYQGASIMGISYGEFHSRYMNKDLELAGPSGYRMLGKVTNLSCQFRIKADKLMQQAKSQYGVDLTRAEAQALIDSYAKAYPGVSGTGGYWESAIEYAKHFGYVQTLAGRRRYISNWNSDAYNCEQEAINFPIQGTGADQKCLAIHLLNKYFPKVRFMLDLHDGLWLLVPKEHAERTILECKQMLNDIDYYAWWGVDMTIPMLWDAAIGPNMGDMRGVG